MSASWQSTKIQNCVSAAGNCQSGKTFPCLCCSPGSFPRRVQGKRKWRESGEEVVVREGIWGGLGGGGDGVLGD